MSKAVFLDRDGVINALVRTPAGVDSPQRPEELRLLPGAAEGIRLLNARGLPVIAVSNQPGIAKGKSSLALLAETTELLHYLLRCEAAYVEAVYYCLHHPEAALTEYRIDCECRKPKPGLLRQAAADFGLDLARSYLVGDRHVDIAAGAAVGCTTIKVRGEQAEPPGESAPLVPSLGLALSEAEGKGERVVESRNASLPTAVCESLREAAMWIAECEDTTRGATLVAEG